MDLKNSLSNIKIEFTIVLSTICAFSALLRKIYMLSYLILFLILVFKIGWTNDSYISATLNLFENRKPLKTPEDKSFYSAIINEIRSINSNFYKNCC